MTTSDDGYERALSDLNAHAEQLEAENKRLRMALGDIASLDYASAATNGLACRAIGRARAALEGADNDHE